MDSEIFYLTPPPNLTGTLHIGHILNISIQRYITMYRKIFLLQSYYNILGFDHASLYAEIIAKQQNTNDIIQTIKDNSKQFESVIQSQLKQYKYIHHNDVTVYTQSKIAYEIVKNTYSVLQQKKIIHEGHKVVYFDTTNKTAVSDIEVVTKTHNSVLYYIAYKLCDLPGHIVVATTRPETIENDVAIICHPQDVRYAKYINQYVYNPLNNVKIKIYAHKSVAIEFGSGAVKITPYFDKKDELIFRDLHMQEKPHVIFDTQTLTFNSMSMFHNMTIQQARKLSIETIKQKNLYIKQEETVSKCHIYIRTGEPVLQVISKQTFINISQLENISPVKLHNIDIIGCVGHKELNMFTHNMDMWCISRNNKYGHKINNITLDTWFASSLWPIICERTVNKTIQTCVIITGYDIMFFWIYKMFYMSQLHGDNKIHKVIVHGLMCDERGEKISKSKNNNKDISFTTPQEYEINVLGIMLHSVLQKRIKYDNTKFILAKKIINKIIHIGAFMTLHNKDKQMYNVYSESYLVQIVIYEIVTILYDDETAISNINNIYYVLKNVISNTIINYYKIKQNDYYHNVLYTSFKLFLKFMHCICAYTPHEVYSKLYADTIETQISLNELKSILDENISLIHMIIKFHIDNTKQTVFFLESKNNDECIKDMFSTQIKYTHTIELKNVIVYFDNQQKHNKFAKQIIQKLYS